MLNFKWENNLVQIEIGHPEDYRFDKDDHRLYLFYDTCSRDEYYPQDIDRIMNYIIENMDKDSHQYIRFRLYDGLIPVRDIPFLCRFDDFSYDYEIEGGCYSHEYFVASIEIDCQPSEYDLIDGLVDHVEPYNYPDTITVFYRDDDKKISGLLDLLHDKGSYFFDRMMSKKLKLDDDPYLLDNDLTVRDLQYSFVRLD